MAEAVQTVDPTEVVSNGGQKDLGTSPDIHSRGLKRSRSPEEGELGDYGSPQLDDAKPRKRGRPMKGKTPESPQRGSQPATPARMPQPNGKLEQQASPVQPSPPRATPATKPANNLASGREHTSDQPAPPGDEYIEIAWDDEGEKKVTKTGHLTGGREYKCRTFFVPGRERKLFMLATECARVLEYRDSYLLFNKNRSLMKIIANQLEKENLIDQDILPYAYRSRQIAIVTARAMFRQFGARVIVNGRRVRDDYFEEKAREKGFTEDDLASGKKAAPPVAVKKDEPTNPTALHANAMDLLQGNKIVYQEAVNPRGDFDAIYGLSNFGIAPDGRTLFLTDDMQPRYYPNIQRPRQDITGTPYQDRTTSNTASEIINQASQAAELSRGINRQRMQRAQFLKDSWNREHKVEQSELDAQAQAGESQFDEDRRDSSTQMLPPAINSPVSPPNIANHPGMAQQQMRGQMPPSQIQALLAQQQQQSQAARMMQQAHLANSAAAPMHQRSQAQMNNMSMQQRQQGYQYPNPAANMAGAYNPLAAANTYYSQQTQPNQMWSAPQGSPMGQPHPQHSSMSPYQHLHQQSPHHNQGSPPMQQQQQQSPLQQVMHSAPHQSPMANSASGAYPGMGLSGSTYAQQQQQIDGRAGMYQQPGMAASPQHQQYMMQQNQQGASNAITPMGWPSMGNDNSGNFAF